MRPLKIASRATRRVGISSLILLLSGAGLPAGGQTDPRQSQGADGSIFLVPTGRGAELEFESGKRLSLPVATGGDLNSLVAAQEGWLAAGTVLHEEGRRELRLWQGDEDRAEAWQPPPGQRAFLRDKPVLLSSNGAVKGLAWLEGENPQELAVMAASWDGTRWGRPEKVSSAALSSQLAPTGVVLADGSWLLAWSAVDGEDDEVFWALRRNGAWTPPKRATTDNQVPDVVPTLAATPRGALLAWSRFDGETYRVTMARFDGSKFVDERHVDELDSTDPRFVAGPAGPRLLYRVASPRGWALLELDGRGKALARSLLETTIREERPLVVDEASGHLSLRFQGEREARVLVRQ